MDDIEDQKSGIKLFGWEITKTSSEKKKEKVLKSPAPPTDADGAGYVTGGGGHYGLYVDLDGGTAEKDTVKLILKYRGMALYPDVDMGIEEIVNEAISATENEPSVSLSFKDDIKLSDAIKKKVNAEFDGIYNMLNFNEHGHDIFRSWYIDGRLYHHLLVDQNNMSKGIQEIRNLDAMKTRKVKNIKYDKNEESGVRIVKSVEEFFIYDDKVNKTMPAGRGRGGIKLTSESVSYVTSGLLDERKKRVISHLHKVIKSLNQLKMMEDSLVIYRLARAPERRIFYIDVGNLGKGKAEQYMKDIMSRYRNKLVYDSSTGEIKDDRKHMSMLEDFWLPRKEGGRGTEISTLPGGQNLGEIDDIIYFQKKLYKGLNVPISRLEQDNQFSLGRATEITREEVKFQRFIDRLRIRFGRFFLDILRKQLILKGIMTEEDWENIKSDITIDYQRDNHFAELKNVEITRERLTTMDQIVQYAGDYYSKAWIQKNVMKLDEEEIKQMNKEIDEEKAAGEHDDPMPGQEQEVPPEPPPEPEPIVIPVPDPKTNQKKEETLMISNELMEANADFLKSAADFLRED
jgi:hypothetical protein